MTWKNKYKHLTPKTDHLSNSHRRQEGTLKLCFKYTVHSHIFGLLHWEHAMLKAYLPLLFCLALLMSCSPTVQVAAPEQPITINLNVKIEHEIKVQVEKELDDVLNQDSGLF